MTITISDYRERVSYKPRGDDEASPADWWKDADIRYAENEREHAAVQAPAGQSPPSLEEQFSALARQWTSKIKGHSLMGRAALNPAHLDILKLGNGAIPLILKRLKSDPTPWFITLRMIAGHSPVKPKDAGNIQKMTEAWLAWGKENGYID